MVQALPGTPSIVSHRDQLKGVLCNTDTGRSISHRGGQGRYQSTATCGRAGQGRPQMLQ